MLNLPKDDNTMKERGCFEYGTILIKSILLYHPMLYFLQIIITHYITYGKYDVIATYR